MNPVKRNRPLFLSRAQFAALQGWSPSYVTKLGDQGRLVLSDDGLVNVLATLATLAQTADPARAHLRQRHHAGRVAKHVAPFLRHDAPAEEEGGAGIRPPSYYLSRARRECALGDLAEIELKRACASLVERRRVEATAQAAGEAMMAAAMDLAARLAPVLAAMTDAFEIEVHFRQALRDMLAEVTARLAGFPNEPTDQSGPTAS